MEFILAGILLVVFGSFVVALLQMAIMGLWRALKWVVCLPFHVVRFMWGARPTRVTTPEATQGCVVYQFPRRT